ncbi:MAG: MATE family efflux transporter [Christensenellales bacterium]|nr:MATE family efflux transporter [Christensenellales bacterium]
MVKAVVGDREFHKKFLSLVLPIALQQLMLAAVSASDAVMLNFVSQDKMSAVSLAVQITFVENLFLAAMTIGQSMLAAQYWGKKDVAAVEKVFAYVMKITVMVAWFFFLAALCVPSFLMRLLTNEPVLIAEGATYLRIVSPSYLLAGVSQVYLCALKNSGKARQAGVISAVCMAGDMLMNAALIAGLWGFPRLEIAGAAISTTVARTVEVLWCMAETARKNSVKLRRKYMLHTDRRLAGSFWKHTAPVLGNEIVWGVGFTMVSVIMGHLGRDAVAAHAIAGVVKNLAACLCLGLAGGGGILIGNELGAGRLARARAYGGRLCALALLAGVVSGAVLLACSPLILALAEISDTAAGYLRGMLHICAWYMIGKSVNATTVAGIFCAGGDSRFGLLCDAVVMWGIIVPTGLLAAFVLRLPVMAVYLLVSLDELLKLPAVYRHYKTYAWVKDLTIEEER